MCRASVFFPSEGGTRTPEAYHVIDWMEDCRDFGRYGAFIMNLDLVIGVDTAVVHLAGALGRPMWLLKSIQQLWRWLVEREDSPWISRHAAHFPQKKLGVFGTTCDARA